MIRQEHESSSPQVRPTMNNWYKDWRITNFVYNEYTIHYYTSITNNTSNGDDMECQTI